MAVEIPPDELTGIKRDISVSRMQYKIGDKVKWDYLNKPIGKVIEVQPGYSLYDQLTLMRYRVAWEDETMGTSGWLPESELTAVENDNET